MKKIIRQVLSFALIIAIGASFWMVNPSFADEEGQSSSVGGTNISLSPVSKTLSISSDAIYEDKFEVKNGGDSDMEIEVYAAPYSYVYSEDDDSYKLGFANENNYTQISRWINFKTDSGNWSKDKATYTIKGNQARNIEYRIVTPSSIPAGGQYAVIFAHTLTGVVSSNGIKTEASPGLIIFARSNEGESITKAEITNLNIDKSKNDGNDSVKSDFYASAKVKNVGNVDFLATGTLTVTPIIGSSSYETPSERGRISVIPETELVVSDQWDESPSFGIYKATWTVKAAGETETIEKIIFVNPLPLVIGVILVLTFIVGGIIIMVRKRKERRSRMAV